MQRTKKVLSFLLCYSVLFTSMNVSAQRINTGSARLVNRPKVLALVQTQFCISSCTLSVPVTTGDTIAIPAENMVTTNGTPCATITDSLGTIYTAIQTENDSQFFLGVATSSGTDTVTGGTVQCYMSINEISDVNTVSPIDIQTTNRQFNACSVSVTTTLASDFIISWTGSGQVTGTLTGPSGAGWSFLSGSGSSGPSLNGYSQIGNAGSYSAGWTWSGTATFLDCGIVALKKA